MLQLSTGLRNQLLTTNPFSTIFDLSAVTVFSTSAGVPASADAALVGGTHVPLCVYSNNNTATGLTFAATASAGVLTKNLSETWSHAAANTGTAAFWRLTAVGDTGATTTTECRVQGLCNTAGAEMNLDSLSFVATTVYTLDNFSIALPTL